MARYSGGIVLTGGGSALRGFAEVVQQITDMPARVASPTGVTGMNDEIAGPHHATVVGLLRWGTRLRGRSTRTQPALVSASGRGASHQTGGAFARWLRDLF